MDLSVIVPTLREPTDIPVIPYLERCEFEDYEVIVRDDVPVTKARNEGFRRARADKILFLDDDSMPRNGYLAEASNTLVGEAVVAGRTVHPRDDIFSGGMTDHYDFGDRPRYVSRFWGCNVGMRREALEAVGGWDEEMGWGHEEKELAERLLSAYPIYYNPEMVVQHVYAGSVVEYWHKQYRLERNTPYYQRKQGLSTEEILLRTIGDLIDPRNYLRKSMSRTVAHAGGTVAGAAGRIAGLLDGRLPKVPADRTWD